MFKCHVVASDQKKRIIYIFTVRNSSCGKVMFLHLSVILFTGGIHPLADTPSLTDTSHPPDGHCSGRYTSYWNTFLSVVDLLQFLAPLYSSIYLYFQGPKEMAYQVLIKWQRTQSQSDVPTLIRTLREHGYKYLAGEICFACTPRALQNTF